MNPKVSYIVAFLVALYGFAGNVIGVHLPALPTGWENTVGTVLMFIMGLFTKSPIAPAPVNESKPLAR